MSHIWLQEFCDQHRGQSAQHWQWTQRPKGPAAQRRQMMDFATNDHEIHDFSDGIPRYSDDEIRWWNQGLTVNHTY